MRASGLCLIAPGPACTFPPPPPPLPACALPPPPPPPPAALAAAPAFAFGAPPRSLADMTTEKTWGVGPVRTSQIRRPYVTKRVARQYAVPFPRRRRSPSHTRGGQGVGGGCKEVLSEPK